MSIERIADAADREEWLETRKRYLTASAIYGWRGPAFADKKNAWYFEDNNREAICAEKFQGYEKEFTRYATVGMAHGRWDEENIARKFEDGIGFKVETANDMFVNDRWPHLAATVDGYIHTDQYVHDINDVGENEYCQEEGLFEAMHLRIMGRGTGLLEIKKSVSVAWARNQVPEYYVAQVQTQLHITDVPWAIIVAECICKHPKEKWRMFWDLRPTVIKRDPAWADVLDQCNAEFKKELDAAESV